MSQEDVGLYFAAFDAFNRGDKAKWMEIVHPELENFPPSEWPESRTTKGAEAVWEFLVEGTVPWDEVKFEVVGPIEEGNETLLVHVEGKMVGRASGAAVPWSYYQVVTIRDERMARFDWFADRAEALEVAGISGSAG
jgi:ketosteroid isomerase-like protein